MASMTIRSIDDRLKARLRIQAAQHGRSMEEEVRHILRAALPDEPAPSTSLAEAIRRRLEPLGGVEPDLPPREPIRDPVNFSA